MLVCEKIGRIGGQFENNSRREKGSRVVPISRYRSNDNKEWGWRTDNLKAECNRSEKFANWRSNQLILNNFAKSCRKKWCNHWNIGCDFSKGKRAET